MANDPIYGSMSPETIKKFKSWQMRTIVVSMIGYAIFYFVRKTRLAFFENIHETSQICAIDSSNIFFTLHILASIIVPPCN